jgi:glycosyltransferase involved in cell wall biosynthesis
MIVSIVRPPLGAFHPEAEGLSLNGANLAFSTSLRLFANADEVEALEVFLPPRDMMPVERLRACADQVLLPHRRGQGRLRFHAVHNLPLVWGDAAPRLLFCQDLALLARDRYLRDRFAEGPMAISCDTHCLGHASIWQAFRDLARLAPTSFDRAITSRAVGEGIRRAFAEFGVDVPFSLSERPRPIDVREFQPASPDQQRLARRALQLPETGTIALYLGRLTPNAKADLLPLVDAFAAARGGGDTLVVAGVENAPGYASRIAAHASQRRVGDAVVVRTVVPPALRPLFFAAADVFVFPGDTVQEAMCLVAAEAMASGLPVVSSDWDGVRDLVRDGETGYLVPTYAMETLNEIEALFPASDFLTDFLYLAQSTYVDMDTLAERLRALLRDPALRQRMGESGRRRAEAHFSHASWWAATAPEWQAQVREAAAEPPAEAARRREEARTSGYAQPYFALFRHYATHAVDDDTVFGLTPQGERVWRREEPLAFYDETLPVLEPNAVQVLLEAFASSRELKLGHVVAAAARASGAPESRIRFAVALLLKRGVLKIIPKESPGIGLNRRSGGSAELEVHRSER